MKFAIVCALILAPFAIADESPKSAKVEQLLSVMNIEQQQKEMMDQMSQMVMQQVRQQMAKDNHIPPAEMAKLEDRQKKLLALIADKTSWQNMKPVFVKAYADVFTEPEIDGIIAFYKTPAGKAMVDKQPTLNGKIMTLVQAQMADLMPQIEALMR